MWIMREKGDRGWGGWGKGWGQAKEPASQRARVCPNSGKEKTHKHKQICGIVPGLGGCQKVVYVFFSRVIPYGGEKKT